MDKMEKKRKIVKKKKDRQIGYNENCQMFATEANIQVVLWCIQFQYYIIYIILDIFK